MGCCGSATGAAAACPQDETWTYTPPNGKDIVARSAPSFQARRTGRRLAPGETFAVTQTKKVGEVTFLRLAGGEGWLFDAMPGVGTVATRAAAPAPPVAPGGDAASAASSARSPPLLQEERHGVAPAAAAEDYPLHARDAFDEHLVRVGDRSRIDDVGVNDDLACWSCQCVS
ncbi:unnamed protein product [Prorocentrum cordatum]|uniref:Altered inheritance of mitochondria protein 24, mitochondrial n=1 Tax=Prorocentrum cordatum TaxID=2364126 RepID=A0ABN9PNS2_9DINO|nr:unnamed protein product [Polarella glacialis]